MRPAGTVLVVDDEEAIRELVRFNLERAGFRVAVAADGAEALAQAARLRPDLVILDVMLPDADGFALYGQLARTAAAPVIFLTARDEETDRVVGLELGADDYVTKPFSPRELVARVRAVLRRQERRGASAAGDTPEVIRAGALTIDLARHEVRRGETVVPLTPREFDLLACLARNAGRVLTRGQILDQVWGENFYGDDRIVDVHIRHLREKLEPDAGEPRHIKTVRGVGYRFDA